jgi:hypothetical protein
MAGTSTGLSSPHESPSRATNSDPSMTAAMASAFRTDSTASDRSVKRALRTGSPPFQRRRCR